jgi:serine protease
MRRFLSILLALGLVLSFSLMTSVPVLAAPEVWVDDDFDSSTPGWGTTHFDSIQDGIDAADLGGATVHVADGTYYEDITLKNGVDVMGAGASGTTIDGTGGGSVVAAASISSGTVFDGFTIIDGDASYGGGMYINSSTLTVSSCVFQSNNASNGGGMYIVDASPTVNSCTFDNNTADTRGAGIFCMSDSAPLIVNNIIVNNTLSGLSPVGGGGIYSNSSSSPTIINNTIASNTAEGRGAGIYFVNTSTTITNNIIYDNQATIDGGGVYCSTPSPTLEYNDVTSNSPNEYSGCSGGTGAIAADPLFDDAQYHIVYPDSPCIDVGDNSAPSLPSTDFEGDPRIFDGDDDGTDTVDIGADEYYVAPPPPPPPPPPRGAVGGTVYPVDKAAILLPWLGLGAVLVLVAGSLILIRRQSFK